MFIKKKKKKHFPGTRFFRFVLQNGFYKLEVRFYEQRLAMDPGVIKYEITKLLNFLIVCIYLNNKQTINMLICYVIIFI